jgi:phenylalanyl-tRNA synthetase beta chain
MIITFNSLKLLLTGENDQIIKNIDQIIKNIINNNLIIGGFELENTTIIKKNWQGLIVGKLLNIQTVENSNKLNLCTVFDGKKNLSIVCGGIGLEINKNYILAPIGSQVGNLLIKERKVFNNLSEGMLCGWEELGINYPNMSLIDDDFIPGTPIENLYEIDFWQDEIYDISITPNRPDCLSIIGLCREIIAHSKGSIKWKFFNNSSIKPSLNNNLNISIDTDNCYGFYTTIIENVNNYTPLWLKIILQNLGFKSISLPVDINNFLLAKYGYPSHVYNNKSIDNTIVQEVNKGEFLGLDEKIYIIENNSLVLKNNEILCLLGLLGGKNSSYNNSHQLVLEVGYFNNLIINKTIKFLKINSKSGYINSRWVDPTIIYIVIQEFINMLNNPYLNEKSNNIIISNTKNHCNKSIEYSSKEIFLPYDLWYKVTGYELSIEKQVNYLNLLGFNSKFHKISKNDGSNNFIIGLLAIVPHWRISDIQNSYNLIEEIIRIDGINKYSSISIDNKKYQTIDISENQWIHTTVIENILVNLNYKQIICNPFTINSYNSGIKILSGSTFLQKSLIDNLIECGHNSLDKGYKQMAIFEIGEIFIPQEIISLGGLYYNNQLCQQQLLNKIRQDINILINQLNNSYCHKYLSFSEGNIPEYYNPKKSFLINYNNKVIGFIGIVHYKYNLELPMVIWEIFNINDIINNKVIDYQDNLFIKSLDISFYIYNKHLINEIIQEFYQNNSIINIDIIDVYQKDNLSYTLKIYWQYNNIQDGVPEILLEKLYIILKKYQCVIR